MPAIRPEVENLMARLTATARLGAEARLEQARSVLQLLESARPEAAILVAARLLDAGGFANAVRSAELSRMAIDPCRWAPAQVAAPLPEIQGGVAGRRVGSRLLAELKGLWRRAPMAVILLAWGAMGLIGGGLIALFRDQWPGSIVMLSVEFWAVGLLTLVVSVFYARIRK